MRILLDTCAFLWITQGSDALSPAAIEAFVNPENEVYLSVVSAWEINVKSQLGKLPLPPERFIPKERKRHLIASLNLSEKDTLHLCKLPALHKYPFDRMLICQALEHSLTILTPAPLIRQYPIRCLWQARG
ncbi:Twitching motility protein PilT [Candidatus Desulfarcum epimagneticum]|uniref:Twitching motility protein PilT n=1 Tax=uncultured Desulfobacteraceae bacterium TaxID=218296 RepID=A0A484HBS5_9BACT|nr:Twitching motility protein PilT [uncultured Desulfobacteraceae bacterium]